MTISIAALDQSRWPDLAGLFGPNGAVAGCWCMWWRLPNRDFGGNDANREALHEIVADGRPTGLLAYDEDAAVGW